MSSCNLLEYIMFRTTHLSSLTNRVDISIHIPTPHQIHIPEHRTLLPTTSQTTLPTAICHPTIHRTPMQNQPPSPIRTPVRPSQHYPYPMKPTQLAHQTNNPPTKHTAAASEPLPCAVPITVTRARASTLYFRWVRELSPVAEREPQGW